MQIIAAALHILLQPPQLEIRLKQSVRLILWHEVQNSAGL
jgi:hypothetical protein